MWRRILDRWHRWPRWRRVALAAILALAVILAVASDSRMVIPQYEIDARQITAPVRIALVTDLHSCYYGKDQRELIDAIDGQAPDLIVMAGDIFDDEMKDANTERFLAGIAGRYPCYYVTGNHEYWSGAADFAAKMAILEQYGVTVLDGDCETVEIRGQILDICGVEDPDVYTVRYDKKADPQGYKKAKEEKLDVFQRQLEAVKARTAEGHFTVLLSHRPEHFERYVACGYDLVLCGHAHGGQWRIPGLLNGLLAPDQGLFPKYAGGRYDQDGTTMIVSRGLARESTPVPRFFNPPELVIITVK